MAFSDLFRRPPGDGAILHLPDRRNGRRMAVVSLVLAAAGIRHMAVLPWLRARRLGDLERRALASSGCEIAHRLPRSARLLVTDRSGPVIRAEKTLRIRYDLASALARPLDRRELFLPILFHPDQINAETYRAADRLSARRNRPIRILFAGNCDPATYDTALIGRQYGLANRHELHRLAQSLPGDMAVFPQSRAELDAMIGEAERSGRKIDRLVWIDTRRFRIPAAQWFKLIASADIFLCTPGVRYPWCQNLNEAMACGTVALLEYPGLYNPALEPGVNALTLDAADLGASIASMLALGETEIARLSAAAAAYHREHLSLGRAIGAIGAFLADPDMPALDWYLAGKA
ncbi:MAG: hypothetical protein KDJ80_11805 [Nitratireductor sp.]|nr:hypothetical protein [Nitratireductor sp.]